MTTQTPATEERLSRLEGAYEQVNERLGDLRADVTRLAQSQDAFREEVREEVRSLRSEMNSRFNILLLLIGGVWATTVGGFIALFTRL